VFIILALPPPEVCLVHFFLFHFVNCTYSVNKFELNWMCLLYRARNGLRNIYFILFSLFTPLT